MSVAKALVQGVDVWVNTPTRMEEASGTSGMKAAANGGLNLSIADGWWPEAADGSNGWTIGGDRIYESQDLQDEADATAFYRILEEDVVPTYFARSVDGVPQVWAAMMRDTLASVPAMFSTDRMVSDYLDQAYRPLAANYFAQQARKKRPARIAAKSFARVRSGFEKVKITAATTIELQEFKVGQHLEVCLEADLGSLRPDDITAELVVTRTADGGSETFVVEMKHAGPVSGSVHGYEGSHRVERAGQYHYGMRVRVMGNGRHDAKVRGLVLWA